MVVMGAKAIRQLITPPLRETIHLDDDSLTKKKFQSPIHRRQVHATPDFLPHTPGGQRLRMSRENGENFFSRSRPTEPLRGELRADSVNAVLRFHHNVIIAKHSH